MERLGRVKDFCDMGIKHCENKYPTRGLINRREMQGGMIKIRRNLSDQGEEDSGELEEN